MDVVERELRELGRQLAWPPTPDVVARVQAAIGAERAGARSRGATERVRALRPALVVAALAFLLAVVATAAIPPARSALLRWLGVTGVSVRTVPHLPSARTTAPLRLGTPVQLNAAARAIPFALRIPRPLGRPDLVLLRRQPAPSVTLVYRPRPGLPPLPGTARIGVLLTEFVGDSTPFIEKMIPEASRVLRADVGGDRGWWLVKPHLVLVHYGTRPATVYTEARRVRGKVLIWEHGAVALRLESNLSRSRAIALARSMR